MSGIAGYFGTPQELAVLQAMVRKLHHRGPDAEGFHIEPPVHMGVRRLATIDLAEDWLPLYSEDRKLAIVFAGALYNYQEEREKLLKKGLAFKTNTDTEVALQLYRAYGANCVNHMRGQFVFAIHDMHKDLAFIARDHAGAQPLYYTTTQAGSFVFASEIKSLLEHPAVRAIPDLTGIDAYLSLGYSPGGSGMFKGIHLLPPGHRLIWNPGLHVMVEPYWQWESFASPDPALKTDEDFHERFGQLFEESVRLRMVADVPVGAFATGSLESSAILSVMAHESSKPVSVFSTSFGAERDGVPPASEIAGRLGCAYSEVAFEPEFMDRLPELIWALDAPSGDPNILMMHLVSRLASQKVKVVMSGIGSNNLFVNYPQHDTLLAAHKKSKFFWKSVTDMKRVMPLKSIAQKLHFPDIATPRGKLKFHDFAETMRTGSVHQQFMCLSSLLDARDKQDLYLGPLSLVMGTFTDQHKERSAWPTFMATLLAMQKDHLLPDGILGPVGRMTMFSSLSARMPLMDHKLIEFMLGVPDHLRRHGEKRKVLLRHYAEKAMPGLTSAVQREAVAPGKKGLLEACLAAGSLKEMADMCLSEASVRRRELFEWSDVRQVITAAKAGDPLCMKQVFSLLTLELWFRIFIDHEKGWLSQ